MPNRKKRKVYQFKQFDNLLTSSNIFNTLKKFREKKQVSIWKQFNSFDLSTTEQILNQISFSNFNLEKIKNVNLENTALTKETYNYGYMYSSNSGNYKSIPKISVQEKPVYDSQFWNDNNSDTTTPKDLSDLNGLVQTMDKSEIKLLCDERPDLIADYILAVYSGYDLTDEKDCELYFDETKQPQYFDDTKPYGNTTTTKKGVNNAK